MHGPEINCLHQPILQMRKLSPKEKELNTGLVGGTGRAASRAVPWAQISFWYLTASKPQNGT